MGGRRVDRTRSTRQGGGRRLPVVALLAGAGALAAAAVAVPATSAVVRSRPPSSGTAAAKVPAATSPSAQAVGAARARARARTPSRTAAPAAKPPAVKVVDAGAVVVDGAAAGYPIHPEIFGACGSEGPDLQLFRDIRLPLCRWGGDATSRYNWQVNATNSGVDWFFYGGTADGGSKAGAAVDQRLDAAAKIGAKGLVTIPIGPFVERSGDGACGFSVAKYGADTVGNGDRLPYDVNGKGARDCALGRTAGGKDFTGNDVADTSTPNSPALQAAWVKHLVARYGPSSRSGIVYQLDNEPSNWAFLHRDVVRARPTYDELIRRGQEYAAAIKAADPTAKIAGPSEIQFAWYPDWGGTANMVAYLKAMKAYEDAHGVRLLDVFTVHYPDANDGHWPQLTDVDAVRKVVDANYPGTEIGFDEWNLGSDKDPTGGVLTTADQLGVFARDKAALAAYWGLKDAQGKGPVTAFRMYRDYDGKGAAFGETFLPATNPSSSLSVYAARRRSDGALTVLVVNKGGSAVSTAVRVSGATATGAQVFQWTGGTAIRRAGDLTATANGVPGSFPAHSLTMLVLT